MVCSPTESQADQLQQKNLLINHSMMLYILEDVENDHGVKMAYCCKVVMLISTSSLVITRPSKALLSVLVMMSSLRITKLHRV